MGRDGGRASYGTGAVTICDLVDSSGCHQNGGCQGFDLRHFVGGGRVIRAIGVQAASRSLVHPIRGAGPLRSGDRA